MIRIPSYFRDVARDAALVGRDTQIWMIALQELDFFEYRELVPDVLATRFDTPISDATVHRSLTRLVERGYLDRSDDHGPHGKSLYRIPLARIYPRSPSQL